LQIISVTHDEQATFKEGYVYILGTASLGSWQICQLTPLELANASDAGAVALRGYRRRGKEQHFPAGRGVKGASVSVRMRSPGNPRTRVHPRSRINGRPTVPGDVAATVAALSTLRNIALQHRVVDREIASEINRPARIRFCPGKPMQNNSPDTAAMAETICVNLRALLASAED